MDKKIGMIDFGSSTSVANSVYGMNGTADYIPPEIRISATSPYPETHPYDPSKVDVFNLGVILFYLAFGQRPFGESTHDDSLYNYIFEMDFDGFLMKHPSTRRPFKEDNLDWDIVRTIMSCL